MFLSSIALIAATLGAEVISAQVGSCFELQLTGPWVSLDSAGADLPGQRISPNDGGDSLNLTPPSLIRLDSVSPRFPNDWLVVVVPETALQTPQQFKLWRMVRDSLYLMFSSGFSGAQGVLARQGSGWQGRLRNFSDALPYARWERPVELVLVDCNAPPRFPASLDRVLLRSVDLISGESIELGRSLPPTITTQSRPSGALTVVGQAAGMFAGTSQVIVTVNAEQLVNHIELHYDVTFDFAALVRSLESRLGSPRSASSSGSTWQNRTTTVYGFPSPATARPARLILIDPRLGR